MYPKVKIYLNIINLVYYQMLSMKFANFYKYLKFIKKTVVLTH